MSKTIALSYSDWNNLKEKISKEYGLATVLISWRLKEQLGFTVREHHEYNADGWFSRCPMRLDFWDEHLQTMFLLKYSDYLNSEGSLTV